MLIVTLIATVLGNAEKIILSPSDFNNINANRNINTSVLELPYSISKPNYLTFDNFASQIVYFKISNISTDFEVRVCWSSSHPVDFNLFVCKECIEEIVGIKAIFTGISYQNVPRTIQFQVIAEELVLKVIPQTTIPTILLSLVWIVLGTLIASYFNFYINQQKSK